MIKRPTLIMLGVFVAALAAYFILKAVPNSPLSAAASTPPATPQPNIVTGIKDSEVNVLILTRPGGAITRLEKDSSGNWSNIPQGKISSGTPEQIISELLAVRVLSSMPLDTVLTSLSLDNPAQVINLQSTGGKKISVAIGALTPTQSGYYVKVDSNQPVIVDKNAIDTIVQLFDQAVPTPTPAPVTGTPGALTPTATP